MLHQVLTFCYRCFTALSHTHIIREEIADTWSSIIQHLSPEDRTLSYITQRNQGTQIQYRYSNTIAHYPLKMSTIQFPLIVPVMSFVSHLLALLSHQRRIQMRIRQPGGHRQFLCDGYSARICALRLVCPQLRPICPCAAPLGGRAEVTGMHPSPRELLPGSKTLARHSSLTPYVANTFCKHASWLSAGFMASCTVQTLLTFFVISFSVLFEKSLVTLKGKSYFLYILLLALEFQILPSGFNPSIHLEFAFRVLDEAGMEFCVSIGEVGYFNSFHWRVQAFPLVLKLLSPVLLPVLKSLRVLFYLTLINLSTAAPISLCLITMTF